MYINKLIHLKLLFYQKLFCFPSEVGCRLSGAEVRLKRMMIMFSDKQLLVAYQPVSLA